MYVLVWLSLPLALWWRLGGGVCGGCPAQKTSTYSMPRGCLSCVACLWSGSYGWEWGGATVQAPNPTGAHGVGGGGRPRGISSERSPMLQRASSSATTRRRRRRRWTRRLRRRRRRGARSPSARTPPTIGRTAVNLISAQVRVQVPPSRRALLRVQVRGLEGQLQSAPGRQGRERPGRLGLGRLGRRSRPEGARRGGDGRPRGPRVLDATRPRPRAL